MANKAVYVVLFLSLLCFSSVKSSCELFVSLGRIDPGWTDSLGRSTFVWRYNITNTGTEPVKSITVGVSDWKNSEVIQKWNLENDDENPLLFQVINHYQIHPGQIWDGAGFIAAGSPFLLPAFATFECI